MKAIINKGEVFGMLDGVITKNKDIYALIHSCVKNGKGKLLLDTETTLMYELPDQKSKNQKIDSGITM